MLKRPLFFGVCFLLLLGLGTGCRTGKREPKGPVLPPPPAFPEYTGEALRLPQRRRPLEDFERTAQLQVTSKTGQPYLLKNSAQAIWGSVAAEIRFAPAGEGPHRVRVTPESPWQMPSLFDNISIWIRDDGEQAATGPHSLSIRLRDARGFLQEIELPYTPEPGWQMLHKRVLESIPLPIQVEEIIWNLPEGSDQPRRTLLEGLTFYQEVLSRIPTRVTYVRPHGYAPAFAPVRANSVTLNFPTSSLAFCPKADTDRLVVSLKQQDQRVFDFTCSSPRDTITYRVTAEESGPRVSLVDASGQETDVWTGPELFGLEHPPSLRFSRVRDQELLLQYTGGIGVTLSLSERTLVVTLETLREDVARMSLGSLSGDSFLTVPFFRTGKQEPLPIGVKAAGDRSRFISLIPDWWASMATEFEHDPRPDHLGTLRYHPRWRGSRNLFRERMYFTVADNLSSVIPSIAAPQSLYMEETLGQAFEPVSKESPLSLLMLRPTDPEWADQWLARTPEGEWLRYPEADGVVMKSSLAEVLVLPRILESPDPVVSSDYLFIPQATRFGPWRFTDSDQRVVGAGTFAQTYADIGALFQQVEAELGKPLIGAGGAEWLWAGLVSGFIPEDVAPESPTDPLLPQVAWTSIRPSSRLIGMGDTSSFAFPGEGPEFAPVWMDRSLAFQVAYGAPGRVPQDELPDWKCARAEYLVQVIQEAIAGRQAERFSYSDGKTLLDVGQAIHQGALTRNHLYIRLDDQTEIWVNGSSTLPWTVRVEEREWKLPPYGFVLRGPEAFIVHIPGPSGMNNTIVLQTPDQLWISSPEEELDQLGIRVKGCLRMTASAPGERRIDLMGWSGSASFQLETLGLRTVGSVRAVDVKGTPVPNVQMLQEEGRWVLRSETPLKTVWIFERVQGGDRKFSP